MGAQAAKKRAASRAARKRSSASPAPTKRSTSVPPAVNPKSVSTLTEVQLKSIDELKVIPKCKPQGAGKPGKNPPVTGTHIVTTPATMAEDEQASTTPDDNLKATALATPKLPKRQARMGFKTMLAQIVEQPEINEADRSIGNYEICDNEWESWKAGPIEYEDEYEVGAIADDGYTSDGSDEFPSRLSQISETANARFTKQPLKRQTSVGKSSECQLGTGKTQVTGGPKRKHQELNIHSDDKSDSEVEGECDYVILLEIRHLPTLPLNGAKWAEFKYHVDVSSKSKDIRKMFMQSSTIKWAKFEDNIAGILNIFTANLRVQYILSTEPTGTIPISLSSEEDLIELHTRLAPLIVPPRNANGSKSKRKMKEVTVKITDKSDDMTASASKPSAVANGKKKNEGISSDCSVNPVQEMHLRKLAIRGAITAHWRCEIHTTGDRPVPCWRDGLTNQCYVMSENAISLWTNLHLQNPSAYPINVKPPQINLYDSVRRGPQDRHGQQGQPQMMPMMMGAPNPYYNGFMGPWPIPQPMMGQFAGGQGPTQGPTQGFAGQGVGATNNSAAAGPSGANIAFPDVGEWARYCDTIPKHQRAELGALSDKFTQEGFFEIDQLTGDRISPSDLVKSLDIGMGIAALIIRYAEEDVAQVWAGTFDMEAV